MKHHEQLKKIVFFSRRIPQVDSHYKRIFRPRMYFKTKIKSCIKTLILKCFIDRILWKIVRTNSLLNVVVYCIGRIPARLRPRAVRLFQASLVMFSKVFRALRQHERSLFVARVLRLAFRFRYLKPFSPQSSLFAYSCVQCGDLLRLAIDYKDEKRVSSPDLACLLGRNFLLLGKYRLAESYLKNALDLQGDHPEALRYFGIVQVLLGNIEEAKKTFQLRVKIGLTFLVPHQNLAAGDYAYKIRPIASDIEQAGSLQIYDQLNYMGEQCYLSGKLANSMHAYKQALLHQKKLRSDFELPKHLQKALSHFPNFVPDRPVALLPVEWVTQIGHIGFLDIFLKIEKTERKRICNYVLLAPYSKVSNHHYLSYWEKYLSVVRDKKLIDELIFFQRQLGEGFLPFLNSQDEIEPWTRAGARAQREWDLRAEKPLLTLSEEDREFGKRTLKKMGIPSDAWFVVLHVREPSYYKEPPGHRNAKIANYLKGIKEITKRGGWVIRMGDAKMTPLPKMEQVVDYARSSYKSERMDVFLIASSYLFIGTTSGLTTAAMSFYTQVLLLNIISNDWQLWSNKTHYVPKMIYDPFKKRNLTMSELYLSENRDMLMMQELINRKKWKVVENDEEDILEAIRYKLDVIENKHSITSAQQKCLDTYIRNMEREPYMFGAASIVPGFLERHPDLLSPQLQI